MKVSYEIKLSYLNTPFVNKIIVGKRWARGCWDSLPLERVQCLRPNSAGEGFFLRSLLTIFFQKRVPQANTNPNRSHVIVSDLWRSSVSSGRAQTCLVNHFL